MIILFLPIIDLIFSSFSVIAWPLFTIYGTFWYLLKGASPLALLPQIWLLKMLNISYLELIIITGLELIAFHVHINLYKKSPIFLLFGTLYYLIHIYNYGTNLMALGILFLITAVIWYNEHRGRLDSRFA